jgi:hypothetical protein
MALDQLAQHGDAVECGFQPNTETEFMAEVFLSGKSACRCRIWLGGLHSSDGISYAQGQWHHGSNACNEILDAAVRAAYRNHLGCAYASYKV